MLAYLLDTTIDDQQILAPAKAEHAALCSVAEVARKTVRELEHWHTWRKNTAPDYAESSGCVECEGILTSARDAIATLASVRGQVPAMTAAEHNAFPKGRW